MSFLKSIFSKKIEAAPGYCPNCWGRQEYQNQIKSAARKEQIDLNNLDQKIGWIQAYAAKNLNPIKLIDANGKSICKNC